MLTHHLKMAVNRLSNNRIFTALNLIGLSVGMAVCMLIAQYARFEYGYDRHSPAVDRIWRAFNQTVVDGTVITEDANTHSAIGPSLKNDLPGIVEDYTRIFNRSEPDFVFLRDHQPPVRITGCWIADPGFLRMFPQNLLAGDLAKSLDAPYSLVLSRQAAEQLFGTVEAAIGQTLRIPAEPFYGQFTVKAVVENPPANVHIKFNALASYATRYAQQFRDNWDTYWEYNYFQLAPGADPAVVQAKLDAYSQAFLQREGIRLKMQRFTDIHLQSDLTYEIEPNGSARSLRFLSLVALLVLCIAFINYINLTTAHGIRRMREVGVRRVVGANRRQLLAQFLTEGAVLNFGALALALVWVQLAMPAFSALVDRPLATEPGYDHIFWLMVAGLWASGLLFACLWPAFSLSGFSPTSILKGTSHAPHEKKAARQGLVVFQFACSVVLLVAVFTIQAQLHFLKNHDKGLSLDQIVALRLPKNDWRLDSINLPKLAAMKREIGQLSSIQSVAGSYVVPSLGITTITGSSNPLVWVRNASASAKATTYGFDVEQAFFETYGVRFLAGSFYTAPTQEIAERHIIINEAALKVLGFSNAQAAIGEEVAYERSMDYRRRISGVVSNFHIESLKAPARPTFYVVRPELRDGYLSVKIKGTDTEATIAQMQNIWQRYWPESPLEYHFLDERFDQQYRAEQQLSHVFGLFAGLAVLVACLGLFGLTVFMAERRTKEIGIRKVLGASVAGITRLLAKDFLLLVLVAIVIASPIAWYFMQNWLTGFAYHIELTWWVFALAGLTALLIALLTVGIQSIRAALANPVKSLRSE
jgi:putative ABC transport system permease protein